MKRSGFAIRITAFIEADANDGENMAAALRIIKEQYAIFTAARFLVPELSTRFMLNCTVPDEPKGTATVKPGADGNLTLERTPETLPIPAMLDRRKP